MEFAKKLMQKYGWKDGAGLGKECQGISVALKPNLKTGKEGMGFELGKDLTDTWWTKAYSDSLNRINVSVSSTTDEVDVKITEGDNDKKGKKSRKAKKSKMINLYANPAVEERPMEKMRKRMMNANFTSFAKGGTLLTNGEGLVEEKPEGDAVKEHKPQFKVLSDEELLKACGGRTAHKAARFGLKLNGKLARIAAQEAKDLEMLSSLKSATTALLSGVNSPCISNSEEIGESKGKKKRKKKGKKQKQEEVQTEENIEIAHVDICDEFDISFNIVEETEESAETPKQKGKKRKKSIKSQTHYLHESNLVLVNFETLEEDAKNVGKDKGSCGSDKTKKRMKNQKRDLKRRLLLDCNLDLNENPSEVDLDSQPPKKKRAKLGNTI